MGLIDRIADEHTVRDFRRAARLRFAEARRSDEVGDRLIGIYLAGYAAEMTLKAIYFEIVGNGSTDPITLADIQQARRHAMNTLGITWQKDNSHHLIRWGELLIAERRSRGVPYPVRLARELIVQLARLYKNWRESLRYHGNQPRPNEVADVFQAVQWLLNNRSRLAQ